MSDTPTAARPGLRRVLDALGKLASEFHKGEEAPALDDWRLSLIEGQRNVIKYYRQVLATQRMAPAERHAVLYRIARIEEEIQGLEASLDAPPRLEAA